MTHKCHWSHPEKCDVEIADNKIWCPEHGPLVEEPVRDRVLAAFKRLGKGTCCGRELPKDREEPMSPARKYG